MKKLLLLAVLIMSSLFASAQHFTDFETGTQNAKTFTSDGQVFDITSQSSTFIVQTLYPTTGWNGTKKDNRYIDNSGYSRSNIPCEFTLSSAAGFRMRSFWLYVSTNALAKNSTGEVTVIGYLNGVQQFSVTRNGAWTSDESNPTNGYTFFDFKTYGGQDVTGINIDQVKISSTKSLSYLGLDAFSWYDSLFPATVATGSVENIGSSTATLTSGMSYIGKPAATEYGIVYGTNYDPTIADTKITATAAATVGNYVTNISGLTPGRTYYARPYAINAKGTVYGISTSFTTKKEQAITFPVMTVKTYGVADFDPAASVPGALVVTYTSSNTNVATIVNNKVHIVGAGTATITASQPGNNAYMSADNISQTLIVDKAVLTYTANPLNRKYNESKPLTGGTIDGFVNGDTQSSALTGSLVFTTTADATSPAGASYAINGSGYSAANYTFVQAASNATAYTINKGVVTYKVTQATRAYGQDNPAFTATYAGLANGEAIGNVVAGEIAFTTAASKLSLPGQYAVTTPEITAANYTFVPDADNAVALVVEKAILTVVAQPATRLYGDANPAFTGKLTGFINNDTEDSATSGSLIFGTNATATSGAGNYAITGSGKTSAKYTFVQASENSTALSIGKIKLYYTAAPVSRPYNTANPALTGTLTGFINGDTQATATTGTLAFSAAVDITTAVGTYAITGSGISSANYDMEQAASNASAYSIYLSSNGNLSNLTTSQGTLSPTFESGTNSYSVNLANAFTTIAVTPTLSDANAKVKVNGSDVVSGNDSQSIPLIVGDNIIQVDVTAQDGTTTNPYVITVTRAPSSDASFSAFTVGGTGVLVTQNPGQSTRFDGNVAKDVTSYTITASSTEPNAKVYLNGNLIQAGVAETLALNKGDNFASVEIIAQDGVTRNACYVFIKRAFSAINTLASLTYSAGTLSPAFDSNTDNYTLSVSNTTTSVDFTATLTDTLATMSQDGLPVTSSFTRQLNIGDNNFYITVRAEDGSYKSYQVNVQRSVSSDATLAGLGITSPIGAIETFDPETLTYNTTVAYNVNTLTLKPIANNDASTIKVNGSPVFGNGASYTFQYFSSPETIQIEVTAGDGTTTKTYNVVATREMSDNNLLADLEVTNLTDNYTITPDFDPNIDTYNLTITDPTVALVYVRPTKAESHQAVRVNFGGELNGGAMQFVNLNSGANTIGVRVLSHTGVAKQYTINVNRAASTNANMAYMSVSQNVTGGFSQFFNSFPGEAVSTSVPFNIDSLAISPGPDDAGATSTVNGYPVERDQSSPKMALAPGDNLFKIGITSADRSATKYYDFQVNRLASTDVTLASLTADKGIFNFPFSPDRTSYNVSVGSADEYFTLTPVAHAAGVAVTVNNDTINVSHPSYTNTFPLNTSGTTLFRVVVRAADGVTTKTYSVRVSRQSESSAVLAGITLSSGSVSPAFTAANTNYSASVGYEVSGINFTPNSPEAAAVISVTANGTTTAINGSTPYAAIPLTVGENVVNTTVASLDGNTTQTYTVTIVRGAASSDATLASTGITNRMLSPVFDSAVENYTATLPYSATSIAFAPVVTEAHATIKVNGVDIASGSTSNLFLTGNPIRFEVTAQDGVTKKTYTIATNNEAPSTDATLSNLSLNGASLSPAFASGTTAYTANVDAAITSVRVVPVANDGYAMITVNGLPADTMANGYLAQLTMGINTVTVRVRAQNNTTTTYTVTIRRGAAPNVNLAGITTSVGTLDPAFDPATTEYTVALADTVSQFDISATKADPGTELKVYGMTKASGEAVTLYPGSGDNIIDVKVTSADGTATKTYNVNFKRALSGNANLAAVFIVNGSDFLQISDFDPAVHNYTVNFPTSVTNVDMYPLAQGGGAAMKINGEETSYASPALNEGNNIFVIEVTSENGAATQTYTINIKRAFDARASLASLTTDIGTLEPIFNADTLAYTMNVGADVNVIQFTAAPADPGATVDVNYSTSTVGWLVVNPGDDNNALIKVTSADGTVTKTYTVNVKKPKDTNANLNGAYFYNGSTEVNTLSPAFDPSVHDYTMDVPNTVSSLRFIPYLASQWATVKINGTLYNGLYAPHINPGVNVFIVEVTAQDGIAKQTYTVTINRAFSTNANLNTLSTTVGTLSPAFDKDVLSYSISVPANVSSIGLTAFVADTTARVSLNGGPKQHSYYEHNVSLAYGSNTLTVTATSASGANKVYTITVMRNVASTVATLSALGISTGTLSPATFNPAVLNYTAAVASNTGSVTITAKLTDTKATLSINGITTANNTPSAPVTLVAGLNPIPVKVTAEDGTVNTYTITVKRAPSAVATLSKLYLVEPAVTKTNVASGPGDYNSTAIVTASTNTIRVVAVATDTTATIRVNGVVTASGATSAPVTLTADSTFITIQVTAANNSTIKNYVIKVSKPLSAIATLSKLYLVEPAVAKTNTSTGPGDFNSTAAVAAHVNSIKVVAVASDAGATIKVNGVVTTSGEVSAPVALSGAATNITVQVTSPNNAVVKTYVIKVTKDVLSSVATLSKLYLVSPAVAKTNVSSGPAEYNSTANVSATTKNIKVVAVVTDTTATIRINGVVTASGVPSAPITLNAGENTIDIVVTAQNGTSTHSWAIIVTKPAPTIIAAITNRPNTIDVVQPADEAPAVQPEDITVKQAVSPNGDGINDRFTVEGITAFPENKVQVMNRNGEVVYEAKGYDNQSTAFDGHGSKGTMQQPGTYFYSIEYKKGSETVRKTGYLVLKY